MATYIPLQNTPLQLQDSITSVNMTGGSLEFFLAGTTTATDLFSDNTGNSIGTSIVINSGGYCESGSNVITLFRDQSVALKIVAKDATGLIIWTADNIPAVASFDADSSTKLATIEESADVTDATNVAAAGALMVTGGTMTGDITMASTTFQNASVLVGITASVTQTQGQQALVSEVNEVATVATDLDTVTLPEAAAGRSCTVVNNGANVLQIFPAVDDAIDDLAADAAITLGVGSTLIVKAINALTWETVAQTGLATTVTVAAATHELGNEDFIIVSYTATGVVTVTLMTAQTLDGRVVHIKDSGTASVNNLTIDTEASETIDGAATLVLSSDLGSTSLVSDGTNWHTF